MEIWLTNPAAIRVLGPRLFVSSGCQSSWMQHTNYWLWINPVFSLAETSLRLVMQADYTHTHTGCATQTALYLVGLKSWHPGWSPPAAQRHNRASFMSVRLLCSLSSVFKHAHKRHFMVSFWLCSNPLLTSLIIRGLSIWKLPELGICRQGHSGFCWVSLL